MASILKRQPSNSTSEDDDGVECPLSGAEALAACKEFAAKTSTDSGLAMMMLQQNGWDLQRALDTYQNSSQGESKPSKKKQASLLVFAVRRYFILFCITENRMRNE